MYQVRLQTLERALAKVNHSLTGARVLEIGCGTGFYTHYFSQKGVADYVGLDITSVSVTALQKQYPQFNFLQADVTQPGAEPGTGFDIVLVADVLFHIVDDSAFAIAIQNIASWLRHDGLLVLSDIFPPITTQTATHSRNRSLDDYQIHFCLCGLKILHLEPIFALLQPPPLVPNVSWSWQLYAWLWRYGWRLARWAPLDWLLPRLLGQLDERFFLPRLGVAAPNNKWLLGTKANVA
jgi:SAM-dependent methyltransferase